MSSDSIETVTSTHGFALLCFAELGIIACLSRFESLVCNAVLDFSLTVHGYTLHLVQ